MAYHLYFLNFDKILEPLPLSESFPIEPLISVGVLPQYAYIVNYPKKKICIQMRVVSAQIRNIYPGYPDPDKLKYKLKFINLPNNTK